MAIYLATVGSDPASVALGFQYARDHAKISHVLLYIEQHEQSTLIAKRTQALQTWLGKQQVEVQHCFAPPAALDAAWRMEEALKNLPENLPIYAHILGGTKLASFACYQVAQQHHAKAIFAVEGHGQNLTVYDVEKQSFQTCLPLGLDDYLYLHGLESVDPAALELTKYLKSCESRAFFYKGEYYFLLRIKNSLFVVRDRAIGKKDELKALQEHKYQSVGMYPTLWVRIKSSVTAKNAKNIQNALSKNETATQGFVLPTPKALRYWADTLREALRLFELYTDGPLLVSLVGQQTVPTLVSYLHTRAREVILISSPEFGDVLNRLAYILRLKGVRVHVVDAASSYAPKEIGVLINKIIAETGKQGFTLNLNGCTTLMALEAFNTVRKHPNIHLHYLQDDTLYYLNTGQKLMTTAYPDVDDVIACQGYYITHALRNLPCSTRQLQHTEAYLVGKSSLEVFARDVALEPYLPTNWSWKSKEGFPLEYFAYWHIKKLLPHDTVWCSCHIESFENDADVTEIDVLAYQKLKNLVVECKMDMNAFFNHSFAKVKSKAKALGGRYPRTLLIANKLGNIAKYEGKQDRERLSRFINDLAENYGQDGVVTLWVRDPETLALARQLSPRPETIFQFPEDLPEQMKQWRWL